MNNEHHHHDPHQLAHWIINLVALLLLGLVITGGVLVLEPFFIPLLWAVVVVLTTWPLYQTLRMRLKLGPYSGSFIMTLALAACLLLAVIPLSIRLTSEITDTADVLQRRLDARRIERTLERLPGVGQKAVEAFHSFRSDPEGVTSLVLGFQPRLFAAATGVARQLARVVFIIVFCLITTFFLFVHGEHLWLQLRKAALLIGGENALELLHTVHSTVRGAVYGTVLTALIQGGLAGVGFWIFGAPYPVLLGFTTVIFSFVPFGPPLLYVPVSIGLLLSGAPWYLWGGMVLWGVLVVSTADNLIRTVFISQATQMPILLVLFGALGGIVQFGLIGVLLGPVILALALSIWFTFVTSTAPPKRVEERSSAPQ